MVGATEGERLVPHLPTPLQWAQPPLTFFQFHCPTLYFKTYGQRPNITWYLSSHQGLPHWYLLQQVVNRKEIFCEFFFVMVQTRLLHNVQISKYTFHFWILVIQTLCIYIYHSIELIQLSLSLKMAHKWEDTSLICNNTVTTQNLWFFRRDF
jgi:hypothetical protein